MQEERIAMMQEVKDANVNVLRALAVVPTEDENQENTFSSPQSANNVDDNNVPLQMLELLQKLD